MQTLSNRLSYSLGLVCLCLVTAACTQLPQQAASTQKTSAPLAAEHPLATGVMPTENTGRQDINFESVRKAPPTAFLDIGDSQPAQCPQTGNETCPVPDPASIPKDFWAHLRGQFNLALHLNEPQVQAQLNWFIANPDYLTRVFKRGAL